MSHGRLKLKPASKDWSTGWKESSTVLKLNASPPTRPNNSSNNVRSSFEPAHSYHDAWVSIHVGSPTTSFGIHKDLLISSSKYFKAMFSVALAESRLGVVNLPEDDSVVVHTYIDFLYTGKVAFAHSGEQQQTLSTWETPIRCWIFGDKIQDERFTNATMDAIIHKSQLRDHSGSRWFPTRDLTKLVYQNTTETSPLRELIIAQHVKYGHGSWYEGNTTDDVHPEFMLDLVRALMTDRPAPKITASGSNHDICKYHVHADTRCAKNSV